MERALGQGLLVRNGIIKNSWKMPGRGKAPFGRVKAPLKKHDFLFNILKNMFFPTSPLNCQLVLYSVWPLTNFFGEASTKHFRHHQLLAPPEVLDCASQVRLRPRGAWGVEDHLVQGCVFIHLKTLGTGILTNFLIGDDRDWNNMKQFMVYNYSNGLLLVLINFQVENEQII